MTTYTGGRLQTDAAACVEAMDDVRSTNWATGKTFGFGYDFLTWEVFKLIYSELFLNVGLCLVAGDTTT